MCGVGGQGLEGFFNKALLSKWLWRFGVEGESLWKGVIVDRYCVMEGEWRTNMITIRVWCVEEYNEGVGYFL